MGTTTAKTKVFQGRVIIAPDTFTGKSVVSHPGVNTLATFLLGIITGKDECSDQNNPDLYKKPLAGKVLCLPETIGSTTGGMIIQCAAVDGIAPAAMLFANHIDTVSSAGVLLADIWNNKQIYTVDQLGSEFLEYVKDDMDITIDSTGKVTVVG